MSYLAYEKYNPDSYGYNHKNGKWTGFRLKRSIVNESYELVTLEGQEAFVAVESAKKNEIITEMAVATGAIAMVPITVIGMNKKSYPHEEEDNVIIDDEDPVAEEDESLPGQKKRIKKSSKK